ncbi:MAG: MFS transporter [Clostridia bacterium]|nr:MFS transporter [Clostridia bacterium]
MGLIHEMKKTAKVHLAFEDINTPYIMLEAIFASVLLQLTNPFYQLFATAMGADDVAVGLISSLPSFCALFVLLPASLYIDRIKDKKKFLMTVISICGIALPVIAMSPFLGDRGYWFFIIGISLWNIPYIMYTVSWQIYFNDLYPPSKRAVPYARRQMMTYAVPVVTIMLGGIILSYICKTTEQKILAYQVFFFLAFLASVAQRKMIAKTEYPEELNKDLGGSFSIKTLVSDFGTAIKNLKKYPQFCIFLILLFIFYFGWQMAWPMFFLYLVNGIGLNEFMKSSLDVISYLAQTMTSTWWGKRIEKRGAKESTIYGLLASATVPAWIVMTDNFFVLVINYIFSGATGPGFQLGLFNDMLDNLPDENRSLYIGVYNMVMQISNFIAPLCGVALYTRIGIRNTMIMSSCMRFFAACLFAVRYFVGRKKKEKIM